MQDDDTAKKTLHQYMEGWERELQAMQQVGALSAEERDQAKWKASLLSHVRTMTKDDPMNAEQFTTFSDRMNFIVDAILNMETMPPTTVATRFDIAAVAIAALLPEILKNRRYDA